MVRAIKQIPTTVTTVDQNGKETHEPKSLRMTPPSPDKCQVCAHKHPPSDPHNAQSLYYQMAFNSMIGRAATWADAMAHCNPTTQNLWKTELQRVGAWSEPPNGEAPVKHHGID